MPSPIDRLRELVSAMDEMTIGLGPVGSFQMSGPLDQMDHFIALQGMVTTTIGYLETLERLRNSAAAYEGPDPGDGCMCGVCQSLRAVDDFRIKSGWGT